MKRMMIVAGVLASIAVPAQALQAESKCPQEVDVREAATEVDATQVIALRGTSGQPFLMLVLRSGAGLVMARSETGCFDIMLAMSHQAVIQVLSHSAEA